MKCDPNFFLQFRWGAKEYRPLRPGVGVGGILGMHIDSPYQVSEFVTYGILKTRSVAFILFGSHTHAGDVA